MSASSSMRAFILLVAVFLAGAAVGWVGHDLRGEGSGRGGRRGVDAMVGRLSRELRLSAAQRDSIRVILERRRAETEAIWREVHPRYDAIRDAARAEIETHLTPEQRARYDRYTEEIDRRREKRKSGGQDEGRAR
jgi:hypothetical protein